MRLARNRNRIVSKDREYSTVQYSIVQVQVQHTQCESPDVVSGSEHGTAVRAVLPSESVIASARHRTAHIEDRASRKRVS